MKGSDLQKEIVHEAKELAWLFAYLALFLCALSTYRMVLLNEFHLTYFRYGAALIEALVLAKVILIGEYARLGKRGEDRPLIVSAIYKAFLYSLLVAAFNVLEEAVKGFFHGRNLTGTLYEFRVSDPVARTIIVFCAFIPLFTAIEMQRNLGVDFRMLFQRSQKLNRNSSETGKAA